MNKIIIIGSGFGGLAEAIRLQARGFDVTILEKNKKVGGHAYQLKKDGYTFDLGPSLVTAPDIIEAVFKAAGKEMHDYLDLIKLDPYYRIYFHDKTFIDYSGDNDNMKKQMAQFDPGDAEKYDEFMDACKEIYGAVITDGLGSRPFMSIKSLLDFVPRALKLKAIKSTYGFVKNYFNHPKNRFTFSFHPLFIGGNPFRVPAIYLMIPYLEKNGGVWFTKGGMYSLVRAFEKVFTELGGKIQTGAAVQKIDIKNGKAMGVIANDTFYPADAIVSNADVSHTYKDLIDSGHRKKWTDRAIEKKPYSMSSVVIYIGSKKQYPQLLHHTLIISERYKPLITDIFDKKILPDDFSMYLHAPTRTDKTMAPAGSESMYVLVPVANLASGTDWNNMLEPFTKKVLDFLEYDFGLENLQQNIEVLETMSPLDFKSRRNSYLGTPWGIEPRLTHTAYLRAHNRSEDIDNLYFVGAGTHPGAGVPGVLLTAETTEKVIISDLGDPSGTISKKKSGE